MVNNSTKTNTSHLKSLNKRKMTYGIRNPGLVFNGYKNVTVKQFILLSTTREIVSFVFCITINLSKTTFKFVISKAVVHFSIKNPFPSNLFLIMKIAEILLLDIKQKTINQSCFLQEELVKFSAMITLLKTTFIGILVCLWCLMPLSTLFLLFRGSQFYCWRKPEAQRKPPTYRKSLTNFIT